MSEQQSSITEQMRHGDTQILVGELNSSYQEVDDSGGVEAKVWKSEKGERRLYLRIQDHDDEEGFNEFFVELNKAEGDVWCAKCHEKTVNPDACDLSPAVCRPCRRSIDEELRQNKSSGQDVI